MARTESSACSFPKVEQCHFSSMTFAINLLSLFSHSEFVLQEKDRSATLRITFPASENTQVTVFLTLCRAQVALSNCWCRCHDSLLVLETLAT